MAELSSHNVVNEPQSTSAPLVDAASNPTVADSATDGAQRPEPSIIPHTDSTIDVSKSVNELATSNNALAAPAGSIAVKDAAEPSAGEAAHPPAADPTDAPAQRGDLELKTAEDGSHGDDRSAADIHSDTEKKGDAHHVRSDSVKKPTTFSKVSVTKNFLNKAAPTTAAAPSKIGEKREYIQTLMQEGRESDSLLASPASVATLPPKIGPRLVAKAGPSLGNLQKARPGPQNVGGPDASKVWNKNRREFGMLCRGLEKTNSILAVPQAPPKQFTDEELKQQYGIHLATRLQTDEGNNDSKWADIDDEDDWAPEAVEWMDGTKSTVAPQEAAPSEPQIMQRPAQRPAQQQPQAPAQRTVLQLAPRTQPPLQEPAATKPATEAPAAQQEAPKPAPAPVPADTAKPILAPKRTDSQSMKILKPGAAAIQAKLNGPSASAADKPSLKAKNPAPPQTSPWKPVPKPDSVSAINPPTQAPQAPAQYAPLASQDARSYEQPQQIPARQIAADTFDRSWKEGEGGARELFNSSNGRYEPAPEGRRSSVKHDNFRKPAVLQRQSHGGPSPAEPSAAFQSRTSGQMDGGWGNRRRGSSVSQSSNSAARRMSMQRSHDPPVAVSEGVPPPSVRNEATKPTFSQQSAWDQQMPARPTDAQPSPSLVAEVATPAGPAPESAPSAEDVAKMQARVMREKRELAQKRRAEEEEREAAAKAERLAAKLAALEGAGKSKKERAAEAAAATATKNAPKVAEPAAPVVQPSPATPAETATLVESLEAQTLPPPPPPAQSEKQLPPQGPPTSSTKQQQSLPDIDQAQKQAPRSGPFQQTNPAGYKQSPSSYSSPGDRPLQPFGRSPNNLSSDSFTPWPTTAPSSRSNVWGTSGIGNGTFQSSGAFAPLPMVQQGSSLPLPPGMNRTPTSARISPQGFDTESRSPHMQQQQIGEPQRAFPPPGIDAHPADTFGHQARRNGAPSAHGIGNNRQAHPPGPIGPPSRAQPQHHQQQHQPPRAPPGTASAWNMGSNQLPGEYAPDAAAAAAKRREMLNAPSQTADTRFVETFRKTSSNQGPLGAPRRYEKTHYTLHSANGDSVPVNALPTEPTSQSAAAQPATLQPAAPPSAQTQPPAAFSGASASQDIRSHQALESTVRIPDFSQNPAHGGQQPPIGRPQGQHQHMPAGPNHGNANYRMAPLAPSIASKEQSPPPPEADGHPVNHGADSTHPHVKLPRPLAKVRLPPTTTQQQLPAPVQNGSVMMPQRPNSRPPPPGASQPIIQNEGWQARFNGLFGRANLQTETPPSPPKTPPKMSLAVAPVSRAALDDQTVGATVFLPQMQKGSSNADLERGAVVSKPTIDYVFNEELSFGSIPKVYVPRNVSYDISALPKNSKNMLKMGPNSKVHKQVESQTQTGSDHYLFPKNPQGYFANVPLTNLNKMCHYIGGGGKKPYAAQDRTQDRKPPGKHNKSARGGRDGVDGFKVAPVHLGGSRKSAGPRDSQTAIEGANESGSKRGGHRAARGRNHGPTTTAAAPMATPAAQTS